MSKFIFSGKCLNNTALINSNLVMCLVLLLNFVTYSLNMFSFSTFTQFTARRKRRIRLGFNLPTLPYT